MSRTSATSLLALCAVLAACADGATPRTLTAPDAGPARDEAAADGGFAATFDGPYDLRFGGDDALPLASAARVAAAAPSADGSRASGHVGFGFAAPTLGLVDERYSFVARGTDPATSVAAHGEFEMMLTTVTGVEQRFHGNVICMNTAGNVSRIAGQLEKVWINNVQRPITGATHVIWTVTDNGEGQGAVDTASPMFFNNAANAQTHCTVGFPPPQFAVQAGQVQVQP